MLVALRFSDLLPVLLHRQSLRTAGIEVPLGLSKQLHDIQISLCTLQRRRISAPSPLRLGHAAARNLHQLLRRFAVADLLDEALHVSILSDVAQPVPGFVGGFLGLFVAVQLVVQQLFLLGFFLLDLVFDWSQPPLHGNQYHGVANDEPEPAHKQMHTLWGGMQQAFGFLPLGACQSTADVVAERLGGKPGQGQPRHVIFSFLHLFVPHLLQLVSVLS
mmetsp:Transcript_43825/g.115863  ORF Transcript_43825/g.115863 Transcript_43825/m.115863 type:complete len:218 (-) Transcript_43825:689-1342(-)